MNITRGPLWLQVLVLRGKGELLPGPENLRFATGERRKTRMDVAFSSAPVEKTA
jgi:hypothetical protein